MVDIYAKAVGPAVGGKAYTHQYGDGAFTSTADTDTVATNLKTLVYGMAVPRGIYTTTADTLNVATAVSSATVTIARSSAGTSTLTYYYHFIGY